VTVPTLVIHGDSDAVVPIEASGRRTAELVPGAKLVVVPDAPHGLTVTHPTTFDAELLSFFGADLFVLRLLHPARSSA
jgi:non-heme chloroperoxidase